MLTQRKVAAHVIGGSLPSWPPEAELRRDGARARDATCRAHHQCNVRELPARLHHRRLRRCIAVDRVLILHLEDARREIARRCRSRPPWPDRARGTRRRDPVVRPVRERHAGCRCDHPGWRGSAASCEAPIGRALGRRDPRFPSSPSRSHRPSEATRASARRLAGPRRARSGRGIEAGAV